LAYADVFLQQPTTNLELFYSFTRITFRCSKMLVYLGVDIGTTNVKALAMLPDSMQIVAHASAPLQTYTPRPDRAEQDPAELWTAFITVMQEVCREVAEKNHTITSVSFSTAMHSLMALDKAGKPLTNIVLWADNRAEAEAHNLRNQQPLVARALYLETGIPMHPMLPLCKLMFWQRTEPDLLAKTAKFVSIKEFLWYKLTGDFAVDYSIANATGLFDATQLRWSIQALAIAGIRTDQLSDPVSTTHIQLYRPGPDNIGLPAQTPLLIGASDGCLANLGAGAIGAGITTITIGTSGAVRQTTRQPLRDEHGRLFCYILDQGYYVVGGPTNNGANVLQWLSENLTRQRTSSVLSEAATAPPGSDGLLFLPYLLGERAPLWNATIRGSYLNVSGQHSRAHFSRSALEGVLFNLLTISQLLDQQTIPTQVIHANGGFAQSAFWVQMLADIAGVPVRLNASNESGAIGAILLNLKADGVVGSLDEAAGRVRFGPTFSPNIEWRETYQNTFAQFKLAIGFI
jgi:gluconokinase